MAEKAQRRTRAQIEKDEEDAARFAATKAMVIDRADRARALRSKDREFHGLDREFAYAQQELTSSYLKSRDVKHPRDVGAIRETLLRNFLASSGHLPRRYGVSDVSFRAASTSGHMSKEIDIALFDELDSVALMRREGIFEVLPVESVYGVIQVKSRLDTTELASALDNIASFKRLNPLKARLIGRQDRTSERGFGVIFAYESKLDNGAIMAQIADFIAKNPPGIWPNVICILNVGVFGIGDERKGVLLNSDLESVADPVVHFRPDQGDNLLVFYSLLMELLRSTTMEAPPIDRYHTLPLVSGPLSYSFGWGMFAEMSTCNDHGDFSRKILDDKLAMVIDWCSTATPINFMRANDMAAGKPGDNDLAYTRNPGDVLIYNPGQRSLTDILLFPNGGLSYDFINTNGMSILIPYAYSSEQEIINGCPQCAKKKAKKPR